MASSSAAERSQADAELRHRRGEQVIMVFSGQVRVRLHPMPSGLHGPSERLSRRVCTV